MNTTGWLKGLQVTADGTGIVSHAGGGAAVPWAWAGQWRSSTMWDGQLALLAGGAEQAGVLDAFVRLVRWQFGERPASAMVPWRST